jgi:16S rRNA (uracil1498-N3)-methyltransferase
MPRARFKDQRLLLAFPLREGARIDASRDQANYLVNVLRMGVGDAFLVFNGHDGEWRARIAEVSRRGCALEIVEKVRPQTPPADLHYLFAPLKQARLDYMVQKAVEMGVSALRPVVTRHTQVGRINTERMVGNVVEAAEQCGILNLAEVREPVELRHLLDLWPTTDPGRRLLFCDEAEDTMNPLPRLVDIARGPLAVLVGPEGGFSEEERLVLTSKPFVTAIPLGPRILRADTAAVAALAVVQATLGDWL